MNNFKLENTTLWRFPKRGDWYTHKGDYRGNWAPQIPRNLILRYSKLNEVVLDPFVGSGTTIIESKLLSRNSIGIDINPKAVNIAKSRIDFIVSNQCLQTIIEGNALEMTNIKDSSIDLICTHPPYADIIKYSNINGDISLLEPTSFLDHMDKIAKEMYRVLKEEKYCCYMIGDIRIKGNVFPLGFLSVEIFLKNGFILKEIIVKEQFNCKMTNYWKYRNNNFLLLAHEYIFVLYKSKIQK